MRARLAGRTDVGLVRERNEDGFIVVPEHRFAAVADGMGGHMSGDVASALAIDALREFYQKTVGPDRTWPFPYDASVSEEENCLVVGVRLANHQVFDRARSCALDAGMGTTIVAVMFTRDARRVVVGHVGDSRCYRIRDGAIAQLTSDHSLVSEVTEIAPWLSAEELQSLPTNVITRALGMAPEVAMDRRTLDTELGDKYLLCSDGLSGMVSDEQILEIAGADTPIESICARLVERANEAGGTDNTTVVLAVVEATPDEEGPTVTG
ncbi:MAG: serine/threonine-protein phosphatase [Deltaproteobacteria bacterium]|nr:serine/threonine-protein phosphatase [Deltaproteobacteria bacterium]